MTNCIDSYMELKNDLVSRCIMTTEEFKYYVIVYNLSAPLFPHLERMAKERHSVLLQTLKISAVI